MDKEVYRRCTNCGTVNLNRDHCKQCGQLINVNLKRELDRERRTQKKQQENKEKKPNKISLFFESTKEHSNPLIRYTAKFFYSIWVIVIAIGSFLAFVLGYIAA
ncbi:hypothetical protein HME9304_03168 [Flagellimonas maritima]|uniref:Uncharacterized protein n=1 Tax=Flagellimonas maritima TaxID=1383885 RepID=A0A2Z4LWP9_9FLAO|nr:hypothetical protein [Allomuricauda aurantiaca]AWX46136.1 hypothetical protein HME9304_03168 [Allomuricauda aurantiaca]